MLLQTTGFLIELVMHSKTSQALLYHSRMFPLGVNRKSMLLQKLLHEDGEESKTEGDSTKKAKRGSPSHQGP